MINQIMARNLRLMEKQMSRDHQSSPDQPILDGKRHEYPVYIDGKFHHDAFYIFFIHPMGHLSPFVVGTYGPIDKPTAYEYLSVD
jgi:hypothetical protein